MSENKLQPLLHEPAMEKISKGHSAGFIDLIRRLAVEARKTNAGTAAVTFSFVQDGEAVDAEFVPEITLRVRHLED